MNSRRIAFLSPAITSLVMLSLATWFIRPSSAARARSTDADSTPIQSSLGKLPLLFIENRGQTDGRVSYYTQGSDKTIYFAPQGLTFALAEKAAPRPPRLAAMSPVGLLIPSLTSPGQKGWSLKLDFIDASPGVKLRAEQQAPTVMSYFRGPRDRWKTGVTSYTRLVYQDLWPGIDLIYAGTADRLKYSFIVKPGADPSRIKLAYRGVSSIGVDRDGRLQVMTPVGGFSDEKPYSYQELDGRRLEVATAYSLDPAQDGGARAYGFRLGAYDTARPLVLDPAMIVYAGFVGGVGDERALGIAVDGSGNAYITGGTTSTSLSFPATPGPIPTFRGVQDAFVAKVNSAGTGLVYAGFIGGSGDDVGFKIAVDSAGNAYVTGATSSTEVTFPVTVGPGLVYNGGAFDAFVAKINPSGTALDYCGYIGGAGTDGGTAIAVDTAGNAYITGGTTSTEATFPVKVGPGLNYKGGVFFGDAFVAKVNPSGTGLIYCGYIGGSGEDAGIGIAIDGAGNAYVVGGTTSTQATFPVTVGPGLTYGGGLRDAFVAKVNATGSALLYCGYVGGSSADTGFGIAVDGAGNAYVTGETSSTEATFPVTVGPRLTHSGGQDAFVAKINPSGTGFVYCGYIGGTGNDGGLGIAVDSAGNAYVSGATHSTEASFPVLSGPGLTFNGGPFYGDAFVAKVNAAGTSLLYCGYIGGPDDELGYAIAVDSFDDAYIAGETSSPAFPAKAGPGLAYNGGFRDAFVAKVSTNLPPQAKCRNVTKPADPGCMAPVSAQEVDNGSVDPDGDAITLSLSPSGPFGLGSTQVTLTATDSRGASSTCTATVTVVDMTPPAIFCPANVTAGNDPGQCFATVNVGKPIVTDNCDAGIAPTGIRDDGKALTDVYPKGTTTITWTATDRAGNKSSCQQTVTVNDLEPPKITCPSNTIAQTTHAGDATVVVNYPAPMATDNCPGVGVVCTSPSGSAFPAGITTVTCTATDASGNKATCAFQVMVFNYCLQDNTTGNMIQWSGSTGDYIFTRCNPGGLTLAGKGTVSVVNSVQILRDSKPDRTINALFLMNQLTGRATVTLITGPGIYQPYSINQTNPHAACACSGP